MSNIEMALVNNDFNAQRKARFQLNTKESKVLENFLREVKEDLATGQTAFLEIEGFQNDITFTLSASE